MQIDNINQNADGNLSFDFPEQSIHKSMMALRDLKIRLYKATLACKLKNISCKILFIDAKGLKEIETQISATCEKSIFTKKNIQIPIKRILTVIF